MADVVTTMRPPGGYPLGADSRNGAIRPEVAHYVGSAEEFLLGHGAKVTGVYGFDSVTRWELGEDRYLLLSSENSSQRAFPAEGGSSGRPVSFGVYCWYAHPTQVAELVAGRGRVPG